MVEGEASTSTKTARGGVEPSSFLQVAHVIVVRQVVTRKRKTRKSTAQHSDVVNRTDATSSPTSSYTYADEAGRSMPYTNSTISRVVVVGDALAEHDTRVDSIKMFP